MFKKTTTRFTLIGCWCIVGLLSRPIHAQPLTAYFQPLPATDTLHVEVSDSIGLGDTIPNQLFFSVIPEEFLQEIEYVADSSIALVLGRHRFLLDDCIEVYWVEIRQYWFQHHSFLLYDKCDNKFTGRVTLAEWFGGEGSQILIGSWVFDFDGDGQKDILRREIGHSLTLDDDDTVLEHFEEAASLLRWENGRFSEAPLADTIEIVKRFPIRSIW